MIKVCHIISGDLWAGVKGLKAFPDLELSVILLNEGSLFEEIVRLDIPCYIIDESKFSFVQMFVKICRILRKSPPISFTPIGIKKIFWRIWFQKQ